MAGSFQIATKRLGKIIFYRKREKKSTKRLWVTHKWLHGSAAGSK
jgi:hypothetical protein